MAAKDQDPTLPAGALLGHWRIARLLGEGGMGRVYLAEHNSIGRKVALKVLKKSLARSPELVERFFAEAHAVNRIRHPGIVEVTDCFLADDGTPCIVMELLIGKTVTEEMASTRLHPTRVAQIGAEVALALDAAHKAGVIHRDLKPDNLFLVEPERVGDLPTVKVLDFGVAKLMDPMPNSTVQTVAGSIMGTPDYMAPEQLAGKPVDARADIYALGASLYHACTGRPPFQATNFGDLVVMHMTKPPTPPTCFANLPVVLEQVLLAMLEKDPARRPQTMGDVALLLRSAQKIGAGLELLAPPRGVDSRSGHGHSHGRSRARVASTLAPRLLPARALDVAVAERADGTGIGTGTEAFLTPLTPLTAGDASSALDDVDMPIVDGEVSGPVILGALLAQARSIERRDSVDGVMSTPSFPSMRAPSSMSASVSTASASPGAARGDVQLASAREGEARAVFLDDASGSFPPSGTLLLGSAEAPEVTDDVNAAQPRESRPLSSWIAGHLDPQAHPSTPLWAWAALGAVLCFAVLGAVWSVGQGKEQRAAARAVAEATVDTHQAAAQAQARMNAEAAPAHLDPYAPLGLAVLDVRSDAPALTSTVNLTSDVRLADGRGDGRGEPTEVRAPAKLKKKPLRKSGGRAAAPTGERRRAVLDPFAAERRR